MNNTYKIINEEFNNKKFKAAQRLEELRQDLYKKAPTIEKIDKEISDVGMSSVYYTLQNPENAADSAKNLQEKIAMLQKEKESVMAQHSIPANWADAAYECPKCKDTGVIFVDSVRQYCDCYKNRFVELAFDNCGMERNVMGTFEKFDPNVFSDVPNEKLYGYKESPREYALKIKERVLKYVKSDFEQLDGKDLLLSGTTGTGKTYLSECAADYLLNEGKTVLYVSAPVMFERIIKEKFGEQEQGFVDMLYSVELLIIDDLGTENRTENKLAELLTIINTRSNKDKSSPHKTIISTNIPLPEIPNYYDDRVASRLLGNSVLIKFSGPDIRMSR